MPQISKITLPSGTVYDLKDAYARNTISSLVGGDAIIFVGVSSTALTDGGTQKPTIDGSQVNPGAGQLFFYGTKEFIWGQDNKWHELGDLDSLGDLAYKDTASASYQPTGTVSAPTFTGTSFNSSGSYTPEGSVTAPIISVDTAGSTTTIKNPTSVTVAKTVVAAAPGVTAPANSLTYYSVTDENLSLYQIGYTTGASITTSNVTVKDGDATYTASTPTFTGTAKNVTVSGIPTGDVSQPTFTGTQSTITVS